ncbi:MAG: NERD domain-containing protein [Coriobacteriales bacterium]|nr:NERD domain-containing protein [Coriobacteriales bacterium]
MKKRPGLFDRVKIEVDRKFDNLFNFGDWVIDAAKGTGEYKNTGSQGERLTYNIIRELFPRHRIFRNVYIAKADGNLTEIDLLAISEKGVFVFESKNYSGLIFGNSEVRYWTATLPNRQKNRFYNPIWQNTSHIEALKDVWGDTYPEAKYYSLIVFGERCELKKIENNEPDTFVFQRQELRFFIRQIMRDHPLGVLSEKEVEDVATWLKDHERPDEEIKRQHLDQLEKAAHTCPWCGSELVERHSKKTGDSFIGCSAFPKCRYTAKKET